MYEITIKKTVVEEQPESQVYERISDRGGEDGGVLYGYVAKPAHEKLVTKIVFQQTVDNSINFLDVIAAINGAEFKQNDALTTSTYSTTTICIVVNHI